MSELTNDEKNVAKSLTELIEKKLVEYRKYKNLPATKDYVDIVYTVVEEAFEENQEYLDGELG